MLRPNPDAPDAYLTFLPYAGEQRYPACILKDASGTDVTDQHPAPVMGSPSGVSWGYDGSGPSRLAATILAAHFPLLPDAPRTEDEVWASLGYPRGCEADAEASEERISALSPTAVERLYSTVDAAVAHLPVQLTSGEVVAAEVWTLHHDFKRDFIAQLSQEGEHTITAEQVRDWLKDRRW